MVILIPVAKSLCQLEEQKARSDGERALVIVMIDPDRKKSVSNLQRHSLLQVNPQGPFDSNIALFVGQLCSKPICELALKLCVDDMNPLTA
jgi:hypothetical protein